ncbi:hypothetical protein WL236_13265, partial [Staphylococcus capitis]
QGNKNEGGKADQSNTNKGNGILNGGSQSNVNKGDHQDASKPSDNDHKDHSDDPKDDGKDNHHKGDKDD